MNGKFVTLRLHLLKVAGRVIETASRVRIAFAAAACRPSCSAALLATSIRPGRDQRG